MYPNITKAIRASRKERQQKGLKGEEEGEDEGKKKKKRRQCLPAILLLLKTRGKRKRGKGAEKGEIPREGCAKKGGWTHEYR